MNRQTKTTMDHHAFTLAVGILTFALIALNVANATDHGPGPAPSPPQVAVLLEDTQKIEIGTESGAIVQNQKEDGESGSQTVEIGQGAHGGIVQNGSGTESVEIKTP